ncbi:VanZ family protein [Leifsonia sp. RAF41]|uniref:VanZ family protein n=1 Tax=Leifsonia sp. RAF41 TaxID=3233056 RepID=UPI003F99573F
MTPSRSGRSPRSSTLTTILFAAYLVLLVGLVLFKFPFNYETGDSGRHLNLIPFAGSYTAGGVVGWSEVIENVIVFVPYGVYLSMLTSGWSIGRRLLPILITTVAFETVQYVFAIGRSDITDVLANALGGVLGIGIYAGVARLLGARTNRVLNAVALVLTIVVVLAWAFLGVHSMGASPSGHARTLTAANS